jgi:hypothetical protein
MGVFGTWPTVQENAITEPYGGSVRAGSGRLWSLNVTRAVGHAPLRLSTGCRTEIRILFVFDPWRSAVLLVAGDKSGRWDTWYRTAIPRAEQLYEDYLAEREKEMGK